MPVTEALIDSAADPVEVAVFVDVRVLLGLAVNVDEYVDDALDDEDEDEVAVSEGF